MLRALSFKMYFKMYVKYQIKQTGDIWAFEKRYL